MIETIRLLEESGIIEDLILSYPVNGVVQSKGTLSTFNVTIKSITEKQPTRKTITDSVWGMDGEYDFSTPETYSRRTFNIVFNFYEEIGNRADQRDAFVQWLLGADCRGKTNTFKQAVTMERSLRKGAVYKDLWISIGDFTPTNGKEKYVSELKVTISTAPRYTKNGVETI